MNRYSYVTMFLTTKYPSC